MVLQTEKTCFERTAFSECLKDTELLDYFNLGAQYGLGMCGETRNY
jgi:hypothetical protein